MAQRISRAKQTIKASGVPFRLPTAGEQAARLTAVLHVLYLIFNEGYTSSSGPELVRTDLSREAIRLTRAVHRLLTDDTEVAGLLALMLLTDLRRGARTGPHGQLIPLTEQDLAGDVPSLIARAISTEDRLERRRRLLADHSVRGDRESVTWLVAISWRRCVLD
jgi:predicted RNA polymerase sigma factor